MNQLEILIALLVVVVVLVTIARRVLIPYPILLVLGGLALSFVPNLPSVHLHPDLIFLVFLPPILWSAAYLTSLRDFRAELRLIVLLAVGLVVATTVAVAAVARLLLSGMPWAAAFALGAVVSPPDAAAATAIGRQLRIPHRILTVLEGESLINDASALVLYRAAVTAAVTGSFVLTETLLEFVLVATGGVVVGLIVGGATRLALRVTGDSLAHTAITLLAPYAAWVLAERVHVSAVLACVVGGLYLRQAFSALVPPATRLQARAVWDLLVFVLNGLVFTLIGLQVDAIRTAGLPGNLSTLLWQGAAVSATAIGIRLVWVPLAMLAPRLGRPRHRRHDPIPPWSHVTLVAWTGMRGIVSLAAALALPMTFPYRDEIILLSFAVILATLVLQGLTLTPLMRALDLREDDTLARQEADARQEAARAALAHLEQIAGDTGRYPDLIERLRSAYDQRLRRASPLAGADDDVSARTQAAYRRLVHEALEAERRALITLRDRGVISDEVLHRLEQELDVEAMRIGLGEARLPD